MVRKFNYTGRISIARSDVAVCTRQGTSGLEFDASWELGSYALPPNARIFIEAYYRTSYARFDFGTVQVRQNPPNLGLESIGSNDIHFRLKVVNGNDGTILASVDHIEAAPPGVESANRRSILHVQPRDLGETVWCLHFDGAIPVLEVNDSIPNVKDLILNDPRFFALVWPPVVRGILTRLLVVDDYEYQDGAADWRNYWLDFTKTFFRADPPDSDEFDKAEWIEAATAAFCRMHRICSNLTDALGG